MPYIQQFQLPDGTPDWSKAPADAQFYHAENSDVYETFFKLGEDGDIYFVSPHSNNMDRWMPDMWGDEQKMRDLPNLIAKA